MALIEGVDVVFYGICNMDRAIAFYEGVLGLELSHRAGNDWAQFSVGGTELGLFGELATSPHQGGATVTFRVPDIRALEAALDAAGAKRDPVEDMGGAPSMEFLDPDGNKMVAVELQQA